ncbi:hypothetical protein [Schaalia hyovaginalis]|uniref:hypothetical protein n=1 Tax=Schaalia hyovaginalis TaxID=29316 RepID=UPI002A74E7C0|nr:hypothetical protein [Schaalia hyovaginalis]MDY2669070.1 hypothetical protein [Schaalia hyovaginalis]
MRTVPIGHAPMSAKMTCGESDGLDGRRIIVLLFTFFAALLVFFFPVFPALSVHKYTLLFVGFMQLFYLPVAAKGWWIRRLVWERDLDVIQCVDSWVLWILRVFYVAFYLCAMLAFVISATSRIYGTHFIAAPLLAFGFFSDIGLQLRGFFLQPHRAFLALDAEGFTARGTDGRISTFAWADSPRVCGVNTRGRLVLTSPRSGLPVMDLGWLPIRYSAIERIVNYYVEHKEARAALGSEEGLRQIERLCR